MNIRIECYLAILKRYKAKYPDAHFEVITRISKSVSSFESVLSPSKKLLYRAKYNEKMDFERYKSLYLEEIFNNPDALKRIEELREIAKDKVVFLVCYERDPEVCHRSIVKKIIERVIKL